MADAALSWLAFTHNAVFSVIHENQRYVLRLQKDKRAVQSEARLLQRLADFGLSAPLPLEVIEQASVSALLLSHLEGETRTPATVTAHDLHAIGAFLAALHDAELSTQNRPRLDWDGLFSATGIYYPGDENMRVFDESQRRIMQAVAEKVQAVMQRLSSDTGLIHGDLLLKNILFEGDQLHALDWEYAGWGYYLYDLAPLLWQLKPHRDYRRLEDALWQGYASTRHIDDNQRHLLETLIAGRHVASMRWIAANQDNPYVKGKVADILAQRSAELRHYLNTNEVHRA